MNIEEIITKECTGEVLEQAEKKQLQHWLEEDSKHHQVYAQLKLSLLAPETKDLDATESRVWNDLSSRLGKNGVQKKSSHHISWFYRIAAIIVLGLAGTFLIVELTSGSGSDLQVEMQMMEKLTESGQKITTTLPDGTKVKLNAESKLIVPEKFEANRREVELIGEAFFEVIRNEVAPFIVKSGDMQVKVLGTSFNVRAYGDESTLQVGVKTGKVQVKGSEQDLEQVVTLLPNDLSIWSSQEKKLKKTQIEEPDAVFGWTEQKLVFGNHNLPEVLKTLSKWYDVRFIDQKQAMVSERTFTYKAQNPTLHEMMTALAHVYDFEFSINNNEVTLK